MTRPSSGNFGRSTVACSARTRVLVRPGATTTHSPIASGAQPRSRAIPCARQPRMSIVAIRSLISTILVLSSITSRVPEAACQPTIVDHHPIAEVGERDLRDDEPSADGCEPRRHGFMQSCVAAVQHPVQVGSCQRTDPSKRAPSAFAYRRMSPNRTRSRWPDSIRIATPRGIPAAMLTPFWRRRRRSRRARSDAPMRWSSTPAASLRALTRGLRRCRFRP